MLSCLGYGRTHAWDRLDDVEGALCVGLMLVTCVIVTLCLQKPGLQCRGKYQCVLVLEEKKFLQVVLWDMLLQTFTFIISMSKDCTSTLSYLR